MIGRTILRALALASAVALPLAAQGRQPATPPGPATGPFPTMPGSENPHGPATGGPREVLGKVERLTSSGPVAVPGAMVTLHRVGPDGEGPVDSLRTDAQGGYRLRYKASGSANAIYFVATSWQGIAYFTPPLRAAKVEGNGARLTVYDTTSRLVQLAMRGRHLIVSAPDSSGSRVVIEVYELSNDSSRTLVGPDSSTPTLTLPVPTAAREVMVGQGDVPPDATGTAPGALRVFAPFSPGLKQLSFSYRLGKEAFPASFPLDRATSVLEVLIEDPSGSVSGAALKDAGPVQADGRTFKRFLGENIAAGGALTVSASGELPSKANLYVIGLAFAVGVALLGGLARTAFQARGRPRAVVVSDDPEALAREIADLDRAFERQPGASDGDRAAYQQARAALKERLTLVLARRDGDA